MIIQDFSPFIGQHCETTATGTLLNQIGIELSEPMLFGLGEGLGFIYWKMKSMDFPFIGGRVKPDILTENLCNNLNLDLKIQETTSLKKAWEHVQELLSHGQVVGLKLDCYHLEYFTNKIHFAGHYVAMYGLDDRNAYLIDTDQQGGRVQTSRKSLELARSEKGPMSSRNRSFTIKKKGGLPDLKKVIPKAILRNAHEYLNPPIKNVSFKGIQKAAKELLKWFDSNPSARHDFQTISVLMERAGTGGALFRNLYRDFLLESYECLQIEGIYQAHLSFKDIAQSWTNVSELFFQTGATQNRQFLVQASEILLELSEREKSAMQHLLTVCESKSST